MPLALDAASKSAATMLTVQYAKSQPGIRFNALEPGTTATDMTAAFGIGRSVVDSARTVVRLATLGPDGPTGTFTDEHGTLNWRAWRRADDPTTENGPHDREVDELPLDRDRERRRTPA